MRRARGASSEITSITRRQNQDVTFAFALYMGNVSHTGSGGGGKRVEWNDIKEREYCHQHASLHRVLPSIVSTPTLDERRMALKEGGYPVNDAWRVDAASTSGTLSE